MTCAACIVCGRTLDEVFSEPGSGMVGSINQPADAVVFWTSGAYGSTVYDPMDWVKESGEDKEESESERIEINVCDPCILAAAGKGRVLHFRNRKDTFPVPWKPDVLTLDELDEKRWGKLSDEDVDRIVLAYENRDEEA